MWKWIAGGLVSVLFLAAATAYYLSDKLYLRFPHTPVAESEFDGRYSPADLQSDFRFITAKIEHVHPNIAAVTDSAAYAAKKREIVAQLNHPMTRLEFFRVISTLNGSFKDGHTQILCPAEEFSAYKRGGLFPPFAVAVDGDEIRIARSMGVSLPAGAELIALNGADARQLARWMLERASGEALAGRQAYVAARFPRYSWAYGLKAPYRISYRVNDGPVRTAIANGVPDAVWQVQSGFDSIRSMKLSIAGVTAVLYLRNFDQPPGAYSEFLAQAFRHIKDAKVANLIIDLRSNNGGDSREADQLQTYLSDKHLPTLRSVTVKTTREVKAAYRTLLPEGFRWIPLNNVVPMLRGIETAPDDGSYTFDPDPPAPVDRPSKADTAFHGALYVLIGPYTYSTAVLFASPLKYWRRAILVGETTAEPLDFFGDNYEFDAPHTKLVSDVSHKTFYLFGATDFHTGLKPDIAVAPGGPDAMELALRAIAQSNERKSREASRP